MRNEDRNPILVFLFLSCALILLHPASAFASSSDASKAINPRQEISIGWSLTNDPEALKCLIRACDEKAVGVAGKTGMSRRELSTEACKQEHLKRVRGTWAGSVGGPRLLPLEPGEREDLLSRLMGCAIAPSFHSDRRSAVLVAYPAVGKKAPQAEPEPLHKMPGFPAVASSITQSRSINPAPPYAKPMSRQPAVWSGEEGSCVLPANYALLRQSRFALILQVKSGADFAGLGRSSCISKKYETDAASVVKRNTVEVTIPYCRKGASLLFSPSRYGDILSGRRKLVIGGESDRDFLARCAVDGGTVGTALQEGSRLFLAAKDLAEGPEQTSMSAETPDAESVSSKTGDTVGAAGGQFVGTQAGLANAAFAGTEEAENRNYCPCEDLVSHSMPEKRRDGHAENLETLEMGVSAVRPWARDGP